MEALDRFLNLEINHEKREFEQDLVLPPSVLGDLVAAADILTATGRGNFRLKETDFNDPDGVKVHYSGDIDFINFAVLADEVSLKFKQPKPNTLKPGIGNPNTSNLLTGESNPNAE